MLLCAADADSVVGMGRASVDGVSGGRYLANGSSLARHVVCEFTGTHVWSTPVQPSAPWSGGKPIGVGGVTRGRLARLAPRVSVRLCVFGNGVGV